MTAEKQATKIVRSMAFLFVLIGVLIRLLPLLDHGGRFLQMYPIEDGYLMLTIARNVAMGKGVSIADGTIPTNGTQPLVTLLWALCFLIVGGDKIGGVVLVHILQVMASLISAFLIYRLGLIVFEARPTRNEISLLAATAWYGSAVVVPHTMNFLETGVYVIAVLLVAIIFSERDAERARPWSWRKCAAVGLLLGAAFWVRNDAVFLILAACLVHLSNGLGRGLDALAARFRRMLAFGSISVLTALPWLAFNYFAFGHIMPVSGRAERLTGTFGSNRYHLAPALSEYAAVVIPIPWTIRRETYTLVATIVIMALLIPLTWLLCTRAIRTERSLIVLIGVFGTGLCVFYGLFFGAPWFMPRFLFPLSPLMALGSAAVILHAYQRMHRRSPRFGLAAAAALLLVVIAFHVRDYEKGDRHAHFPMVRWVEEHVSDETWVGSLQTGTLGYFHDRTINLDGKVNLDAYNAIVSRRLVEYVIDDTPIVYLADWIESIKRWHSVPRIGESFEMVVADDTKNLGVLERKTASRE